jgi:hypothetical protein
MRPFFRELRVDPFPEPALVPAPAQALSQQDLVNPAAPHGDAPVLQQISRQAVERPRGERQTEVAWAGQRGPNKAGDLIRRVGRGTAAAAVIFQGCQAFLIEAPDPTADRLGIQPERRGDGGRRLASAGTPDNAGTLDPPGRFRARAGQCFHGRAHFSGQILEANTHGASPSDEKAP